MRKLIDTEKKRRDEKKIVSSMIAVYCRKKHAERSKTSVISEGGKKIQLCEDCADLLDYAMKRAERCPMMESKTFCSQCRVHCYSPNMQGKIKNVMRTAGPYMLLKNPVAVVRHLIESRKQHKESRTKKRIKHPKRKN